MIDIVDILNIKYQNMLTRDNYKYINNYSKYTMERNAYEPFNKKYSIINKCKNKKLYHKNENYIYSKLPCLNSGFNNICINIFNPLKIKINDLIKHFSIYCGDIEIIKIENDFETHINVLKHFLNSSYEYNEETQYTQISLGLIHENFLFEETIFHHLIFKIITSENNKIFVTADFYEFSLKKFTSLILYNISSNQLNTDTYEYIKKDYHICLLYLTEIDNVIVKHIELFFNDVNVMSIDKETLYEINKKYYNIDSKQIIILLNKDFLNFNVNAINFKFVKVAINVKTKNNVKMNYTLNSLYSELMCFKDGMNASFEKFF